MSNGLLSLLSFAPAEPPAKVLHRTNPPFLSSIDLVKGPHVRGKMEPNERRFVSCNGLAKSVDINRSLS